MSNETGPARPNIPKRIASVYQKWVFPVIGLAAISQAIVVWLPLPATAQDQWLRFLASIPLMDEGYNSRAALGVAILAYWSTHDLNSTLTDIKHTASVIMLKFSPKATRKYIEQGRAEGRAESQAEARAEARAEVHAQWTAWYQRAEEAKAKGLPFDEPPPGPPCDQDSPSDDQ